MENFHKFFKISAEEGLSSIENGKISSIITSPPYFQCREYEPGKENKNSIGKKHSNETFGLGHESSPFEYVKNLASIFGNGNYLIENGSIWIIIGDSFADKNYSDKNFPFTIHKGEQIHINSLLVYEMRKREWKLWQEIIWNKPSVPPSGATKQRCNPCHEYILVFYRHSKPNWNSKEIREEGKTKIGKIMPPVGGKKYGDYKKTIISDGMRCRQDVWTICPSRDKSSHVAPFPDELVEVAMKASTNQGDFVCDPFAGTLTVKRVSEKLGRNSISFDIWDHTRILSKESNNIKSFPENNDLNEEKYKIFKKDNKKIKISL